MSMTCREFRDRHSLLLDVRCSALEEAELRAHMNDCAACARHDMLVRRSQLLIRSLPTIEPSPGFRARLDARLRDVASRPFEMPAEPRPHVPFVPYVGAVAAILVVAIIGTELHDAASEPLRLPPVVASEPALGPSHIATPALVATVPTGMTIWPAIMAASQAPMYFVAAEMTDEH